MTSGHDSPEGPAFHRDGSLFFVNWLSSAILRLAPADPGGTITEFANTGGVPAGLAFHPDGTLYVADEGDQWHGVLRVSPTGEITPWITEYRGQPLNGANDLVFDSNGVLYFSDPWRSSLDRPIGGFYCAFPDGTLEQIDTGLAFPNGVAIARDGSAVYLAETWTNRILRYTIGADGRVGPRTEFAHLADKPGPDGMAFDDAGNLYVAHYNAGRVDVFGPTGRERDRIVLPGSGITNVAFGGRDGRDLVITDVATASVYRTRVDIPGLPLFAATGGPQ